MVKTPAKTNSAEFWRRHPRLRDFRRAIPLSAIALPSVILIFVFCYVPMIGLLIPFKNYKAALGFFGSPWAGLENFKYLFTSNTMAVALRNTVCYNLAFIVFGTAISVLLAAMLFELSAKKVKIFQTIMLLPYFVSWVVASYVLNAFLDMDSGLLNKILTTLGKDPHLWYNESTWWPLFIMIAYLWKQVGYSTIIYYAAFMGLDMECFEAATLDGVTWWQRLRYIMVPGIMPIISITCLMAVGNIFRGDFGLFYNVPLDSSLLYSATDVVDTVVYRSLMKMGDVGMSAAAGFMQSVFGFFLIVFANWLVKKINPDNALY